MIDNTGTERVYLIRLSYDTDRNLNPLIKFDLHGETAFTASLLTIAEYNALPSDIELMNVMSSRIVTKAESEPGACDGNNKFMWYILNE